MTEDNFSAIQYRVRSVRRLEHAGQQGFLCEQSGKRSPRATIIMQEVNCPLFSSPVNVGSYAVPIPLDFIMRMRTRASAL